MILLSWLYFLKERRPRTVYSAGLTLNDEFDMMWDGADRVAEGARIETAVCDAQTDQSHAASHDSHVITGNQLTSVLVPRESRSRRRRRLAEHVDRVALFLDQ